MITMPWGPPDERVALSPDDRKILHDVREKCTELMEKLGELEMYVDALKLQTSVRRQEGTDERPTVDPT